MRANWDNDHIVKVRHRPAQVDADLLQRCMTRVHDVVVDPSLWPEILTELSTAVGAEGTVLLQHEFNHTAVPHSPSITEIITNYFKQNWHKRDLRTRGIPKLLQGLVIGDDDMATPEEMQHTAYYNEMLYPFGVRWFAGVGFRADQELWCLSIQRGINENMFSGEEKRLLGTVSESFSQAATLSRLTGQAALGGIMNGLRMVDQPALLISSTGTVIEINQQADDLLGAHLFVRNRRLGSSFPAIARDLSSFLDRLRLIDGPNLGPILPLVIPRRNRRPLLMRANAIKGEARSPFIGADALLLLTDLDIHGSPVSDLLKSVYRLTPNEIRLITHLGHGADLPQLAEEFGVSTETLRYQLKSVLAKTDTHSQAELIRVITRLPFSASQ